MDEKTFSRIAAGIFLAIAVLHAARLLYGWEAVIGGWSVPMWLSWLALIAAAYLGYAGLRLAR